MKILLRAALGFLVLFGTGFSAHAEKNDVSGINWFDGSIEEAFATAKTQDKPVFLYWGAVWCPPCQEIKANVFTRQDFIDQTRLFTSVYLDGDTDRAQAWGEKLGASGYPTLLVLNSQGEEVLRLSSGDDPSKYALALASAQESLVPFQQLLDRAANPAQAKTLSLNEWNQLAFRSWSGNEGYGERDLYETLLVLAKNTETKLDKNLTEDEMKKAAQLSFIHERFIWESMLWLKPEHIDPAADIENQQPRANAYRRLLDRAFISARFNPVLARIHLTALTYGPSNLVGAYNSHEQTKKLGAGLATELLEIIDKVIEKIELSPIDHLQLLTTKIALHEKSGKETASLVHETQEALTAYLKATKSPYERTALVNAASNSFFAAGQYEASMKVLKDQARRSDTPYYQIAGMARVARKMGKEDEALALYKEAYDGASGPATRAQWGTNYLIALMEISPTEDEKIHGIFDGILTELSEQEDPIRGRTKARMQRIGKAAAQWLDGDAETRGLSHAKLVTRYVTFCETAYDPGEARDSCVAMI